MIPFSRLSCSAGVFVISVRLHLREASSYIITTMWPVADWHCQIVLFNNRHVNCERLAESYSLHEWIGHI